MSERYKGRWLDPRAYELSDGTGWDAEVYIAEDIGAETVDTRYFFARTFKTREVAIEAALCAGKRKVDEIIRSRDLKSVIEDETQLPSTYRPGYGSNDIAQDSGGSPVLVDRPENPEDLYR